MPEMFVHPAVEAVKFKSETFTLYSNDGFLIKLIADTDSDLNPTNGLIVVDA